MAMKCLLIMCLILQSCSFRVPGWSRGPSSVANFNDYKVKMTAFRGKALGSERDANCSKEQLDEDFKRLMASLKKDSCAEDNFTLDKEEFVQKNCPKIKVEGLFDRVVKKTIQEEKAGKPLTYFKNIADPEFLVLFKEARAHLKALDTISIDENYSVDDRIELIATYVENVLLPMRDLVVIKRSYLAKENDGSEYYKKLLPTLPDSLAHGLNTEQLGLLTQGPNPGSSPFYMEIVSGGNRSYLLNFSAAEIIRHDVVTLLKAPSSKNYVLALKWMTLHMMLSQVYLYDTILGTKGALHIPNSCQNQFNGNLPAEFKFKFEDGVGDQFLESILAGHGLTFKKDDTAYLDYYIDNINKDPTKEGYNGMVPFENYKNAKMILSQQASAGGTNRPQFDDVAHFQTIMGFKAAEALRVFKGTVAKRNRGSSTTENITYAGAETFQNILGTFSSDEIAEVKLPDGNTQQIYPGKQNLSTYLLELMKQHGFIDYTQLITERMKKKFAGKKALIAFPSMYSSPVWRDWSLKLLADTFYQYRDLPTNSPLHRMTQGNCERSPSSREVKALCTGNRVQNISNFLSEFRSGEKYIPTRRLEERQFQNIYPLLSMIWTSLRDYTELTPETKPFELNFLLDQMSAGNPWARLKFSYMVALDQLEYKKEGIPPVYEVSGLWFKTNEKAKCEDKNANLQYSKIMQAGQILGLNYPLTYDHADKILSSSEKSFIWKNIIEDINHRNAQLFSVTSGNKDFYKIVEDLSYKTILDQDAALKSGVNITDRTRQEIALAAKSNEAQIGNFFLKLYKVKNDVERQKKLFEEFSKVNGIDNTFNLKLNFLAVDDSYKKPIYKDILRQAAMARKLQILSHLETFCGMDINNQTEFKNIFYSTSKAQNELNQMAGLPSVPEDVLKKINEMSPGEFRDMWWGIGSGVAGMAAIIVGGACTVASGGICAPLGGAMAVAGMASLGIQVKLTSNELERKLDADASEKKVKVMEDLGFANVGSADEVHRSYAWTAFEAISIFPLIGIATRSLTLGPKLAAVSVRSIMQQTGKTAFRSAAKSAVHEEEVRSARYLLGVESVSKNLGLDKKSLDLAKTKIDMVRKLYTSGEINLETMLSRIGKILDPIKRAKIAAAKTVRSETGRVVVKESKAQIDRQASKVVSQYFADNSKDMLRLIQSYSGERLNKAVRIMGEIESKERIGRRIPIYSGVRDWFMRMRNESLAKNASKILRIEKELGSLSSKPGVLQAYINKNIDDLTDIFIDIPMKTRELPYIIQIQGMPDFNFFKGRKIPILSMMSEGQTLKKVFTARARLVYESYKADARVTLKLKRFVQSETTLGAFQSFQYSVAEMASKKTSAEASTIMVEYRTIEEKMTQRLYLKYVESGQKMEYKAFKAMVTNPGNLKDRAISEAIWEAVPADELMGMKEVGTFAHKAVQELANYNDVDSFQRYINALRILVINRDPAVLEIM
ncbi:MAG: hypothetical protein PHY93_17875 [Bacteriovorax sp.]|nr:hypothetical protein [Bacteriovorax sp.]